MEATLLKNNVKIKQMNSTYENVLADLACEIETEANKILDLCTKVNRLRLALENERKKESSRSKNYQKKEII